MGDFGASTAPAEEHGSAHSTPLNKVFRWPEINLPTPTNLFAEIWRNPSEEEEERERLRESGDATSLCRRIESLETELRRERERSKEREVQQDQERLRLVTKCVDLLEERKAQLLEERIAQHEKDQLVQWCEEAEHEVRQYRRLEAEGGKVFAWLGLSTTQAVKRPLPSPCSDKSSEGPAMAEGGETDQANKKDAALCRLRFEAAQHDERRTELQWRIDKEWNRERAETLGRWKGRDSSFEKLRTLPPPFSEEIFEFLVPVQSRSKARQSRFVKCSDLVVTPGGKQPGTRTAFI